MFNIVFHDAATTYYHLQDIQDFLGGWPNPNQLLKSIVFDVKEKVYIAGISIVEKTSPSRRRLFSS